MRDGWERTANRIPRANALGATSAAATEMSDRPGSLAPPTLRVAGSG